LERIYKENKTDNLAEFNLKIIYFLKDAFSIKTESILASSLNLTERSTKRILQHCGILGGDTYLAGTDAKNYLDESLFEGRLKLGYQHFTHPVYKQVYEGFIENLASIDALFNSGGNVLK
jgi:hypothetical protein